MNKDEIKKALVYCAGDSIDDCKACPYADNGPFTCSISMYKDAHTLITEQEKEIEYRKKQYDNQVSENTQLYIEYDKLKDDYAKLQELFAQYQMASDKEIRAQKKEAEKRFENNMKSVLEIEKKQAKIDVLNELKEKRTTVFIDIDEVDEAVFIDDIDELIKEVKNER